MTTILPRSGLLLSLLLAAFFAAAGRADAGTLVPTAANCTPEKIERPFAGDPAAYFLIGDGSFSDDGMGWTSTRASIAYENGPISQANPDLPARSLALAPGGSATSPSVCVGLQHPTMRFFARSDAPDAGRLRVEVLFQDNRGNRYALPIGSMTASAGWAPSAPLAILVNLLALTPDERMAVSFRFTADDAGGWTIDDVYVDPYLKG